MKKNSINNYYAVAKRRATGIFDTWSECQRQVDGFKHNSFKGFPTLESAVNFMMKAGIDMRNIQYVEGEGEVVLRKPLSEKFPNFKNNSPVPDTNVNTVSGIGLRDENESSNETNESSNKTGHLGTDASDIKVISIDGSCKGNGTDRAVGGFGIYWGENHPYNVSEKVPKSGNQTNQVAELMAAVRAVQQVREKGFKEMKIQTDSMYVYNGITSWINKWINSGWKTTQGNDVKHKDLWQQLYDECQMGNISWEHVKGHSGNTENEGADRLASAATEDTQDRTDLFIPSTGREERDNYRRST